MNNNCQHLQMLASVYKGVGLLCGNCWALDGL